MKLKEAYEILRPEKDELTIVGKIFFSIAIPVGCVFMALLLKKP